jgi:hypothetical protein
MAKKNYNIVVRRLNAGFSQSDLQNILNTEFKYEVPIILEKYNSNGIIIYYDLIFYNLIPEYDVLYTTSRNNKILINPTRNNLQNEINKKYNENCFVETLKISNYDCVFHNNNASAVSDNILDIISTVPTSTTIPFINYDTRDEIVKGASSSIIPSTSGATPITYSISPSLPTGLTFDVNTGIISGILNIDFEGYFLVTAKNSFGDGYAGVRVKTVTPSPPVIVYDLNYELIVSDFTSIFPTLVEGDTPITFSISPALPAGLTFDSNTGEINGVPTTQTVLTSYTVTATNAYGSSTSVFDLEVTGINFEVLFTTTRVRSRDGINYGTSAEWVDLNNSIFITDVNSFVTFLNSGGCDNGTNGNNVNNIIVSDISNFVLNTEVVGGITYYKIRAKISTSSQFYTFRCIPHDPTVASFNNKGINDKLIVRELPDTISAFYQSHYNTLYELVSYTLPNISCRLVYNFRNNISSDFININTFNGSNLYIDFNNPTFANPADFENLFINNKITLNPSILILTIVFGEYGTSQGNLTSPFLNTINIMCPNLKEIFLRHANSFINTTNNTTNLFTSFPNSLENFLIVDYFKDVTLFSDMFLNGAVLTNRWSFFAISTLFGNKLPGWDNLKNNTFRINQMKSLIIFNGNTDPFAINIS